MTRLEAMHRFMKYLNAYSHGDLYGMIDAVGLDRELAETMTFSDVVQSISVRVADLRRATGEPVDGDND